MSSSIKNSLKHLAIILISLLIVFYFNDGKGWKLFIGLFFFLLASYHLIKIFLLAQEVFYELIPVAKSKKPLSVKEDKFINRTCKIFFFVSVLYGIVFSKLNGNTFYDMKLIWFSIFLGLLLTIIIVRLIKRRKQEFFCDSSRRFMAYFTLIISLPIILFTTAIICNWGFAKDSTICLKYQITRKSSGGRNKSYWLYITIKDTERKIQVKKEFYESVTQNEQITLCTKSGFFDYDYLVNYSK